MISHALNSGPLNGVPFPLAEEGESIIELSGTVEVTLSLDTLYIRRTIGASTRPSAVCAQAETARKAQVSASASGRAIGANGYVMRKVAFAAVTPASAIDVAGVVALRQGIGASTSCSASGNAAATQKGPMAAWVAASAIATVDSYKLTFLSAAAEARAVSAPTVWVKEISRGAGAQASAATRSAISIKSRLSAGAQCLASATAAGLAKVPLSAITPAKAGATVLAGLRAFQRAQVEVSGYGLVSPAMYMATGAATVATAPGVATQAIKKTLQAKTIARAIATVGAIDLSSSIPAPLERQIIVPPYDRGMKVVV
jgi:hypothetical protein